jgi:acetoin utilization protein AcuB
VGLGTFAVTAARSLLFRAGMSPAPIVEQYMSRSIRTIGKHQTLAHAHELMRRHRVRHLPVLEGGRIVGIVSLRDLHLVETLRDVDPARVTVDDAMSAEPYVVAPGAALREVALEMARRKLGSAVVVRRNKVVGVFTTVDALRALADALPANAGRRAGS